MTRDNIKRMALEAGFSAAKYPSLVSDPDWEALERFFQAAYAAGAAAEREACARVAEDSDHVVPGRGYHDQLGDADATARNIAAAIRARGQA